MNEVTLQVDPEQLKRVFANIVRNAVKAMPKGGELKIRTAKNDKDVWVEFEDNGVGISKET